MIEPTALKRKNKNDIELKAMGDEENSSFIRWQEKSIEQLGFVNNLLTGFSTGLLVFQTQLAFDDQTALKHYEKLLTISSIILIFASLAIIVMLPIFRS